MNHVSYNAIFRTIPVTKQCMAMWNLFLVSLSFTYVNCCIKFGFYCRIVYICLYIKLVYDVFLFFLNYFFRIDFGYNNDMDVLSPTQEYLLQHKEVWNNLQKHLHRSACHLGLAIQNTQSNSAMTSYTATFRAKSEWFPEQEQGCSVFWH